jgi:hypothetical protein
VSAPGEIEETPPDVEATPPAQTKSRKRAAAKAAEEAGVVAAAAAGKEPSAAEMPLPGSEEAARVSAELAAQQAEEVPAAKRQRKPAKLGLKVIYVGAISEENAAKLNEVGVDTTEDLLMRGATRKGRQEMADQTGIDVRRILTRVNHVVCTACMAWASSPSSSGVRRGYCRGVGAAQSREIFRSGWSKSMQNEDWCRVPVSRRLSAGSKKPRPCASDHVLTVAPM